jgi:5'(3')-deoxyribonucleotidase
MKRVLVDMDGVLADVYSQFLKLEANETGVLRNMDETNGKLESEAFPFYEKHVRSKGFFKNAPVIKGSVEGLKYLNNKYEVIILSLQQNFRKAFSRKSCG